MSELAPDRGDGRKVHYGEGKQPLDTMLEMGWAPHFAAGSIIKYLRRTKSPEHSLESARFYYKLLVDKAVDARKPGNPMWATAVGELWNSTLIKLLTVITPEEHELLSDARPLAIPLIATGVKP